MISQKAAIAQNTKLSAILFGPHIKLENTPTLQKMLSPYFGAGDGSIRDAVAAYNSDPEKAPVFAGGQIYIFLEIVDGDYTPVGSTNEDKLFPE